MTIIIIEVFGLVTAYLRDGWRKSFQRGETDACMTAKNNDGFAHKNSFSIIASFLTF